MRFEPSIVGDQGESFDARLSLVRDGNGEPALTAPPDPSKTWWGDDDPAPYPLRWKGR